MINFNLIGFTLNRLCKVFSTNENLSSACSMMIHKEYSPIRPFLIFTDYSPENILGIIADFHIRVFLFSIIVLAFGKLVGFIIFISDYLFYESCLSDKRWFSIYPTFRVIVRKIIDPFTTGYKKLLLNYWSYVFDFDESLEILMVDIMTRSDELYSGKFVDWIPNVGNKNSLVAVGITEVLKYESVKIPHKENNTKPKRRWRLIKNRGEMYISFSEISSIHVWKIPRGTSLTVWIDDENKKERLKWYLLLTAKRLHFIKKINIKFGDEEKANSYCESLLDWIEENDLKNVANKIQVEILSTKDDSGVKNENISNNNS